MLGTPLHDQLQQPDSSTESAQTHTATTVDDTTIDTTIAYDNTVDTTTAHSTTVDTTTAHSTTVHDTAIAHNTVDDTTIAHNTVDDTTIAHDNAVDTTTAHSTTVDDTTIAHNTVDDTTVDTTIAHNNTVDDTTIAHSTTVDDTTIAHNNTVDDTTVDDTTIAHSTTVDDTTIAHSTTVDDTTIAHNNTVDETPAHNTTVDETPAHSTTVDDTTVDDTTVDDTTTAHNTTTAHDTSMTTPAIVEVADVTEATRAVAAFHNSRVCGSIFVNGAAKVTGEGIATSLSDRLCHAPIIDGPFEVDAAAFNHPDLGQRYEDGQPEAATHQSVECDDRRSVVRMFKLKGTHGRFRLDIVRTTADVHLMLQYTRSKRSGATSKPVSDAELHMGLASIAPAMVLQTPPSEPMADRVSTTSALHRHPPESNVREYKTVQLDEPTPAGIQRKVLEHARNYMAEMYALDASRAPRRAYIGIGVADNGSVVGIPVNPSPKDADLETLASNISQQLHGYLKRLFPAPQLDVIVRVKRVVAPKIEELWQAEGNTVYVLSEDDFRRMAKATGQDKMVLFRGAVMTERQQATGRGGAGHRKWCALASTAKGVFEVRDEKLRGWRIKKPGKEVEVPLCVREYDDLCMGEPLILVEVEFDAKRACVSGHPTVLWNMDKFDCPIWDGKHVVALTPFAAWAFHRHRVTPHLLFRPPSIGAHPMPVVVDARSARFPDWMQVFDVNAVGNIPWQGPSGVIMALGLETESVQALCRSLPDMEVWVSVVDTEPGRLEAALQMFRRYLSDTPHHCVRDVRLLPSLASLLEAQPPSSVVREATCTTPAPTTPISHCMVVPHQSQLLGPHPATSEGHACVQRFLAGRRDVPATSAAAEAVDGSESDGGEVDGVNEAQLPWSLVDTAAVDRLQDESLLSQLDAIFDEQQHAGSPSHFVYGKAPFQGIGVTTSLQRVARAFVERRRHDVCVWVPRACDLRQVGPQLQNLLSQYVTTTTRRVLVLADQDISRAISDIDRCVRSCMARKGALFVLFYVKLCQRYVASRDGASEFMFCPFLIDEEKPRFIKHYASHCPQAEQRVRELENTPDHLPVTLLSAAVSLGNCCAAFRMLKSCFAAVPEDTQSRLQRLALLEVMAGCDISDIWLPGTGVELPMWKWLVRRNDGTGGRERLTSMLWAFPLLRSRGIVLSALQEGAYASTDVRRAVAQKIVRCMKAAFRDVCEAGLSLKPWLVLLTADESGGDGLCQMPKWIQMTYERGNKGVFDSVYGVLDSLDDDMEESGYTDSRGQVAILKTQLRLIFTHPRPATSWSTMASSGSSGNPETEWAAILQPLEAFVETNDHSRAERHKLGTIQAQAASELARAFPAQAVTLAKQCVANLRRCVQQHPTRPLKPGLSQQYLLPGLHRASKHLQRASSVMRDVQCKRRLESSIQDLDGLESQLGGPSADRSHAPSNTEAEANRGDRRLPRTESDPEPRARATLRRARGMQHFVHKALQPWEGQPSIDQLLHEAELALPLS
ncbi:hypothetical protein PTSG_05271 [Salpingoeca rosetta]|uniref:Uncharacterized protein n=1 Tax=Salpingoeca rosetta (strain ATCC 50818 / BSB-021) TaxID=946362 RepID=F2U9Y9_SALR5|nr:uncharacterized protein PTSG_05271 [Salpingoeca rosetta]EGD73564.1 hypothetical protein PTSG_05271 [Salpingoeca rosetta]|eukprot:XP_004993846.1 hypothetical protein PTSG_05271 [Salpingoeca rosetta]